MELAASEPGLDVGGRGVKVDWSERVTSVASVPLVSKREAGTDGSWTILPTVKSVPVSKQD